MNHRVVGAVVRGNCDWFLSVTVLVSESEFDFGPGVEVKVGNTLCSVVKVLIWGPEMVSGTTLNQGPYHWITVPLRLD